MIFPFGAFAGAAGLGSCQTRRSAFTVRRGSGQILR